MASIPTTITVQKKTVPALQGAGPEVAAPQRDRQAEYVATLEKGIRSRDEVLAIVAHDLRNPLTIIKTSAALLQVTEDDEQRRELLDMICRSCGQMQSLVGDLLIELIKIVTKVTRTIELRQNKVMCFAN